MCVKRWNENEKKKPKNVQQLHRLESNYKFCRSLSIKHFVECSSAIWSVRWGRQLNIILHTIFIDWFLFLFISVTYHLKSDGYYSNSHHKHEVITSRLRLYKLIDSLFSVFFVFCPVSMDKFNIYARLPVVLLSRILCKTYPSSFWPQPFHLHKYDEHSAIGMVCDGERFSV